jgi:hypothetical protein
MMGRWTLLAASGLFAAGLSTVQSPEPHVLLLMGDSKGYLAPCGCTKPMTGGIRRRASAVRAFSAGKEATVLESGGLAAGAGRQDHLKAEALAEAVRQMGVHALALTGDEARLGPGGVEAIRNLAGDILVQSNLRESETNPIPRFRASGPFLIGAVSSAHVRIAATLREKSVSNEVAAAELAEEAKAVGKTPILMLADGRDEAERLARAVPGLALIQYRSTARPSRALVRIGATILASPGEKGKHVLRLKFEDGQFKEYAPIELSPEFQDDPAVSRTFRRYLARVDQENLLDSLPRSPGPAFAGNAKCGSCHAGAMKSWLASRHSKALRTLIDEGHGRDPDCVGCHVVGLAKTTGFRSVAKTPQLSNVGCESCHGPGAAHAAKPKVKMGKVGAKSCASCHVPDHSPGFEFEAYWAKIKH